MFDTLLRDWRLRVDGEVLHTYSSDLLPVLTLDGEPAMLKRARAPEERAGAALMHWWNGEGAARVLAHRDDVLLMERATGERDLLQWATHDAERDADASAAICGVLQWLHAPRDEPAPALQPLQAWFVALQREATARGGVFAECARIADELLASPQDIVPLHGDCHHHNVLDFGAHGWLAIDPKDRVGERGFDYAQILCNPDLPHAADPARLRRQLAQVSSLGALDVHRLARWTAARAVLSAVWFLEDGDEAPAARDIATAEAALQFLQGELSTR